MLNKLKGMVSKDIDTSKLEKEVLKFMQQAVKQYMEEDRLEEDFAKIVEFLAKHGIKLNLDSDLIFDFAKNPKVTIEEFTKEIAIQYTKLRGAELAKSALLGKKEITAEMLIKGLKLIK